MPLSFYSDPEAENWARYPYVPTEGSYLPWSPTGPTGWQPNRTPAGYVWAGNRTKILPSTGYTPAVAPDPTDQNYYFDPSLGAWINEGTGAVGKWWEAPTWQQTDWAPRNLERAINPQGMNLTYDPVYHRYGSTVQDQGEEWTMDRLVDWLKGLRVPVETGETARQAAMQQPSVRALAQQVNAIPAYLQLPGINQGNEIRSIGPRGLREIASGLTGLTDVAQRWAPGATGVGPTRTTAQQEQFEKEWAQAAAWQPPEWMTQGSAITSSGGLAGTGGGEVSGAGRSWASNQASERAAAMNALWKQWMPTMTELFGPETVVGGGPQTVETAAKPKATSLAAMWGRTPTVWSPATTSTYRPTFRWG